VSPAEATVADPAALLQGRLRAGGRAPEILRVTQSEDVLAVATGYGRGPAVLAGEAAHRFHPLSGTADTCVGDAVDLGGRLAVALAGPGGPDLLAGYRAGRRRHALRERERLARTQQIRHRFGRLAASGATREVLIALLRDWKPGANAQRDQYHANA
jgi:2-polyprenyl-6-methoxyphenol hydroxylase-like FAD-dependent oxidoreductase